MSAVSNLIYAATAAVGHVMMPQARYDKMLCLETGLLLDGIGLFISGTVRRSERWA